MSAFLRFSILLLGLALTGPVAPAEQGADAEPCCANAQCSIVPDSDAMDARLLTDGKYRTGVRCLPGQGITATWDADVDIGTVFWCWDWVKSPRAYTVQELDADGDVLLERTFYDSILYRRYSIVTDGCRGIRMTNAHGGYLGEFYLFAPDRIPADMIGWEQEGRKAELMLIVAHPDDELVMMGGILPTYAGERGTEVQMVYTRPTNRGRMGEALRGLVFSGVQRYPVFFPNFDTNDGTRMDALIVEQLRRFQPEVVVSHDRDGEYGNEMHIRTAASVERAIRLAADATAFPESAERYGVWQVKKLYLHLATERPVTMDFDEPLAAFGGRTAFEMADAAYDFHVSQSSRWREVLQSNEYDCRKYGLVYSAVGEDQRCNDFLENIPGAGKGPGSGWGSGD